MDLAIDASEFDSEKLAIIKKHLDTRCRTDACPMCGANKWVPIGPVSAPVLRTTGGGAPIVGPSGIPLLLLGCLQCYFTMTMLWLPILADANK